ncbi:MAG: hypothetical protein LBQ48_00175 [Oscillospiraceae bacterium]|nr:hypothetical protein [Oscillospiraceae bacterium]
MNELTERTAQKDKTAGKKRGILIIILSAALALTVGFGALWLLLSGNGSDTEPADSGGNVMGDSEEYIITTADQLYELAARSNAHSNDFAGKIVKLGADITVNTGDADKWASAPPTRKWYPITGFAGTFDGQGHTISGIYGKGVDTAVSLFADAKSGSVIQDFKLVNSYFVTIGGAGTASIATGGGGTFQRIYSNAILDCGLDYCAGLVSSVKLPVNLRECWFDGTIRIAGKSAGGLVDHVSSGTLTMENCLFSGNIISTYDLGGARVAGLCGDLEKSGANLIATDCLSAGKITTQNINYTGSAIGVAYLNSTAKFKNTYGSLACYEPAVGKNGAIGTITGSPLEVDGDLITGYGGYQWLNFDFEKYWTVVLGGTPILRYFADEFPDLTGQARAFSLDWYDESAPEFVIQNQQDLYGFYLISGRTDFTGKTIKLGADITVNSGNAASWESNPPSLKWYPIRKFGGTFDGQGHTVSGLYAKGSGQSGFFYETMIGSTVKNFRLTNSYFSCGTTGDALLGSIAGRGNGTFDTIYSNAIVTSSGNVVGGLIGQVNIIDDHIITNCWFDGKVALTGNGRYGGGIVGNLVLGITNIEHCLNTGAVSAEVVDTGVHVGGLVGATMNAGTVVNMRDCLQTGKIDVAYNVCVGSTFGRIVTGTTVNMNDTYATAESYRHPTNGFMGIGDNSAGNCNGSALSFPKAAITGYDGYRWTNLDFNQYWAVVSDGTPILKAFAGSVPALTGLEKMFNFDWYDESKTAYALSNEKDLYGFYLISGRTGFTGKTVKLDADITVNSGSADAWGSNPPSLKWYPIGKFSGIFDGQGHTISGLYVNGNDRMSGFFSETTVGSTVKNLRLENSYFSCDTVGDALLGSIAGRGNGTFDTIYSNAIVTSPGNVVGGLIGQVNTEENHKVTNCWFDGRVALTGAGRYGGGIVGNLVRGTTNIEHCLNTGAVSAEAVDTGVHVGGLVGATMNTDTVVNMSDCLQTGKIDVAYNVCVGSVFGRIMVGTTVNMTDIYATAESYQHPTNGFMGIGDNSAGTRNGSVMSFPKATLLGYGGYRWTTLDFDRYWAVVLDGTPVLKAFASSVPDLTGLEKMFSLDWYDESQTTYALNNAKDLYGFYILSQTVNFLGKTVNLGADIIVNSGSAAEWGTNAPGKVWTPVGTLGLPFAGIFNGQGHTISGLYVKTDAAYAGLFGYTTGDISNLRLENSYFESVRATGFAYLGSVAGCISGNLDTVYSDATVVCGYAMESGGLVGRLTGTGASGIKNCWFDGSVTTAGQYSGGIVGRIAMGAKTLENCLNTGAVASNYAGDDIVAWVGGLCGAIQNGGADPAVTIKDCLNVGKVTVQVANAAGSVLGRNRHTVTFTNVYSTNDISNTNGIIETTNAVPGVGSHSTNGATINGTPVIITEANLLGNGGYKWTTLDFVNYWVALDGTTPELKSFSKGTPLDLTGVVRVDTSWYNETADSFTISSEAELYGFAQLSQTVNFAGKTVSLGADITVNGGSAATWGAAAPEKAWVPIGTSAKPFAGTFNGQGHTISGLYVKTDVARIGFFGEATTGSTIKNLRLENSYFAHTGTSAANYAYIGSVAGLTAGNIDTVYSSATVVCGAAMESGGITGRMFSTGASGIKNCWFDGSVTTDGKYCGGIVGRIAMGAKTLENCLNTGAVTSNYAGDDIVAWVGGLCGAIQNGGADPAVIIKDCLNVGKVTVRVANAAGSVLGRNRHTVTFTNVYSTNDISNTNGIIETINAVPGVGSHSTNGATINGAPVIVTKASILGEGAKTVLTELDFTTYWTTAAGGTPILRSFLNGGK